MSRVHRVVKTIEPHDSVERYSKLGVECISGAAKLISPFEVTVNGRSLTTKNIVIATGATPFVPNLPGIGQVSYRTSDNIWSMEALPKRFLVLGGGAIGCELAQTFARLGSDVTLVESSPRIMAKEDADVSIELEKTFENERVIGR
jgi:pyruvate/2-oxoglutarate dehydrogenase complex dihydrolipoamide dehydrogenase (E3) component